MKIVITATGDQVDQPFNPRFGRADYFILFDTETQKSDSFSNPAADARGGAGPQAVQFLSNKGAEVVISGRYGPSAFTALEAAGIKAYIAKDGTVNDILQQFLDGQLEQVGSATGPGFHG
jgi:predicted Fe-Mo cluster-binding NifX family protein